MNNKEKLVNKLSYLKQALDRLDDMLQESIDPKRAVIDSSIQRFEFCFELAWKTLKVALELQGKPTNFPREVLQESYQGGLIDNDKIWLQMLRDRNNTAHVYDAKAADEVYARIVKEHYKELLNVYKVLQKMV